MTEVLTSPCEINRMDDETVFNRLGAHAIHHPSDHPKRAESPKSCTNGIPSTWYQVHMVCMHSSHLFEFVQIEYAKKKATRYVTDRYPVTLWGFKA